MTYPSKKQCKNCKKESTIEDPKDHFYCDECYQLYSYTRKEYWSNPDAKGLDDKK